MDWHKAYLGLGSNLGHRRQLIERAVSLIADSVGPVVRQSTLVESEPWGFRSDHMFLNGVILCHTLLSPHELLQATQQIERLLGRKQKSTDGYADRPIDIDILLYDDLHIDEPDLVIPHPLIRQRPFVYGPLSEILTTETNDNL